MLESYHVAYDSKVKEVENLMEVGRGAAECTAVGDPCRYSVCQQLALKGLPPQVYETIEVGHVIMVDAPTGYYPRDAPGRMTAIYTAGMMARNVRDDESGGGEADVFVHDVNRVVEDKKFSMAFLCHGPGT